MGLIICNLHGESGFMPFVSIDLSMKILKRELIGTDDIKFVGVKLYDDEDNELMGELKYWMTKADFIELALKVCTP